MLPAIVLMGALIGASGIGGVLLVPVLAHFGGVALPQAIAAASMAFALPALVALGPMRGQREWVLRAVPLLLGGLLGAAAGALVVHWLSVGALMLGVTALVLFAGWRGLATVEAAAGGVALPGRMVLLVIGTLVGFGSALTGTGGPVLLIPVLMLMGQPVLFAVIAGQAIQLPIAFASSTVHALEGRLDIGLALFCGLLMLAGSFAGQRAAARLDVRQLQRMVSVLLLVLGGWFIWIQLN